VVELAARNAVHPHMRSLVLALPFLVVTASAAAQRDHGAAERAMRTPPDSIGRLHMVLTPTRAGTRADSQKAVALLRELRTAIARYADTTAAVRDGYRMFAPHLKTQKTYHFTRNWNGFTSAFRFSASKPTSLLYERDSTGQMKLTGAMYTMPKRASEKRLDERIALSIAQWHKHVNWCVPTKKDQARWLEKKGGLPVFGPESPIATAADCKKVGGDFRESIFGWMVHVNTSAGDDLRAAFGHHH
jgi:hypothetical protein